ncbi:MAG: GNAT family N-acetyltransferase [Rhizobiaceae bacterium]
MYSRQSNESNSKSPGNAVLGRLGTMSVRLARTAAEVRAAQSLRYSVFYREMAARAGVFTSLRRRDADRWDAICDHLIVTDEVDGHEILVGTYRLLRQSVANKHSSSFYTQSEFDIAPLLERHDSLEFLELGRSCILEEWRNKRTIELLWAGTWAYVLRYGVDVMFGCASFNGADPKPHADKLAFLRENASPDPDWDVSAIPGRAAKIIDDQNPDINPRRALAGLPPLIKGYLRLGAWIGRDAVVDQRFNTTDVLIILPVSRLNPRYVNYYGADAGRHRDGAGKIKANA